MDNNVLIPIIWSFCTGCVCWPLHEKFINSRGIEWFCKRRSVNGRTYPFYMTLMLLVIYFVGAGLIFSVSFFPTIFYILYKLVKPPVDYAGLRDVLSKWFTCTMFASIASGFFISIVDEILKWLKRRKKRNQNSAK